ncbi:hypothetical protein KIK15_10530 [Williamsia sp. CHRR-6]|nr:hypothetical protein [Williamsia sp. CHRR-6]MBT0567205.1 hypothetical protein [Williamsia sp. CHRR-6]
MVGRHRDWLTPVLIFLGIRALSVTTLAYFADVRGGTVRGHLSDWDGKWMLAIAQYGYNRVPYSQVDARGLRDDNTPYAFFPGYPMLVGLVDKLPGFSTYGAAMTVNLVAGSLGAVGAARLGALCAARMAARARRRPGWFTDSMPFSARVSTWLTARTDADPVDPRRVGLILVVLFSAAPMGVVLSMAYTEALFCALTVWALVAVMERRWLLAGLTAMGAGLTRPTSVVIVGVVMLAALVAVREGPRVWAALALSPLGYLGYLAVVWHHTGSPTGWFTIQTRGWDTRFDFGSATKEFVRYALTSSAEVAVVASAWIIIASVALVAVAVWERMPWPVLLYGTLLVASIIASSGLMMSRPRLLLPAFVLLIPAAIALARSRLSTQIWVLASVIALSCWFGAHMLTVYPHAI